MKIAILEISAQTHYTLINALIKTYSTNPNNSIVVYTIPAIAKSIQDGGISERTSLVIFDKNKSTAQFFKNIENTAFDRLHICTIEDYYAEFAQFKPNVKDIFFHVHNIDVWFEAEFKNRFKNLIFDLKNNANKILSIARFIKDVLVRQPIKDRILKNMLKTKPYFIVMSHRLKTSLSRFVPDENIIVFPTIINEGLLNNQIENTQSSKIRICIPGIVTDIRRDYTGLFKILDKILPEIKDKLIFDFLGYVDKKELHLLEKIQNLEKKGLEVFYSVGFIDAIKYDEALAKADILLNNQTMKVSHTGQYSVSKESGMIFVIVRASKPAIFPIEYAVDKEFEDTLLYYSSSDSLRDILLGLTDNTINIEKYKKKAIEIAEDYTPHSLYGRLVKEEKIAV